MRIQHSRPAFSQLKMVFSFLLAFGILLSTPLLAQEMKITGVVTDDETGEGLPGVTVMVQGSTIGTITDIDGNYSIAADQNGVLLYSFVGYKTQEVNISGKIKIDVTLIIDEQKLDEVVIVGYGEQKKANLTGAITTVKPERLDEIPTGNLAQTLVGKLAGVQINRNGTGIPGTPTPLVIRDESASGMQRQVLYVIDGVIYSDGNTYAVPGPSGAEVFNRLDPSEIESISILKDAAAAVYGARGAGGVVLVKTKRGQMGKLRFSYNGSMGLGQPTQIPEMLSAEQHANMWNEILDIKKSLGQRPNTNDYFDDEEMAAIIGKNYNWLEGLYKSAVNTKHAMTISGGSEDVKYFMSANYYKETGNYDNLWYKRYSIRSNIEFDITKDLKMSAGINFSQGNRQNPNYDPGSGNTSEGVLREWYKKPLTAPKWIPATYEGHPVYSGSWNPYGLLESKNYKSSTSDNSNISARLEYNVPFISGLKFSSLLSYNINTSNGTTFGQDYEVYDYFTNGGILKNDVQIVKISNSEGLRESFSRGNVYQYNIAANYNNTFGKHNFGATAVYEIQNGNTRGYNASKSVADIRGFDYFWAFQNGANLVDGVYNNGGRWSVIGRLNYDYDGKYLVESNFRAEASNKFHPDVRFGVFPAASVGWVLSEESFFKDNVAFVDFFKLRSSLGIVGNDNSAPFEWKPTFNAGKTGPIFGVGTGAISNAIEAKNNGFFAPSRTWAKTRTFNAGFDLAVWDNKINITSEYYYALTYDGFQRNNNYPFVIGNAKPPVENYKEAFSKGIEVQLEYNDEIGKDIKYSIYGNFTKRRSRPLKLYQNPLVLGTWVDELKNDDSNQPGYVALGIIKDEAQLEEVKQLYPNMTPDKNGDLWINGVKLAPGMIYYKDVGGPGYSSVPDGILDGNDRTIIAEYTTPPYSYGFGFSFTYRAWRLNASFGGVFGHKEFIQKDEQVVDTNSDLVVTPTQNTFAWWGDYWTPDNPNASMPRPSDYGFAGEVSTFWMRNGHTLRMNDISLSYAIPQRLAERIKMKNLKFYASATNVWTIISPFDFKDPAVSRAFDYPLVRMVNTGLSFSM